MTKLLVNDQRLDVVRDSHVIHDDFDRDVDAAEWVKTGDTNSTATVSDAVGGILALATVDATDNDECYVESPNETFLAANHKPIVFEARVKFTEVNTDDANIYVGLMDAVAANALVDNGGGPKTSGSHIGFYKIDGGTTWIAHSSLSTTQTSTTLSAANSLTKTVQTAGGSSYQTLRAEVLPYSSTNADVLFFIDGYHVARHDWVYTSCTEMQIGFGVKNGGANAETLNVDYVHCRQKR